MQGLIADEHEEAGRDRGDGALWPSLHAQPQSHHRRTKSASGRSLGFSRAGVLRSKRKDLNDSNELPTTRNSFCEDIPHVNGSATSDNKASLENDIEQLQFQLQQEKSIQRMLERAMGRASSTLSPGHRHFSAQMELIGEIELLEEEVANREQHVLNLYRNIFEHRVSRSSSAKNSAITSSACSKHGVRKHPCVISCTFCSSVKFPLRTLQVLFSINHSNRLASPLQHKFKNALIMSDKNNMPMEKTCPGRSKVHVKRPNMGRPPVFRNLKAHLYLCPSKLSEKMVRCMAAIYCSFCSMSSGNPGKNQSPLMSRSSTNVILPQQGIETGKDWSCNSMVEILWISTDKNQFSCVSYAISNYRVFVKELEKVNVTQMETNAQTAFWINVYNSLMMHAYLAYGIPRTSLRRLAFFHKATYNIGGHFISANVIERSILCFRTPRYGRWLETILSTAMRKKFGEERQLLNLKFGLPYSQPLVCFALCTGAFSDPLLRVYTASNVKEELEAAKQDFLQSNVVMKKSNKVFLPKLLERFAKEASICAEDLLIWVTQNVDQKLHDSIEKCADHKGNRRFSQIIQWLPHNSSFRYTFSKDLARRPWWV